MIAERVMANIIVSAGHQNVRPAWT
jgi:hypothetical protein